MFRFAQNDINTSLEGEKRRGEKKGGKNYLPTMKSPLPPPNRSHPSWRLLQTEIITGGKCRGVRGVGASTVKRSAGLLCP
jgi:hypothetical protein